MKNTFLVFLLIIFGSSLIHGGKDFESFVKENQISKDELHVTRNIFLDCIKAFYPKDSEIDFIKNMTRIVGEPGSILNMTIRELNENLDQEKTKTIMEETSLQIQACMMMAFSKRNSNFEKCNYQRKNCFKDVDYFTSKFRMKIDKVKKDLIQAIINLDKN